MGVEIRTHDRMREWLGTWIGVRKWVVVARNGIVGKDNR
jgi:hypothetical protein